MTTTAVNPDAWVTSFFRALKAYVLANAPVIAAEPIYEIVSSYPSPGLLSKRMPFEKTLVHFEIANVEQTMFGFGDNVVDWEDNDVPNQIKTEWEASEHLVTLDVGVWASDESGGVTSRLEAYELLDKLFVGSTAFDACLTATDGIEIRELRGGRFLPDTVGDVPIYRIVDIELDVRVFSRKRSVPRTWIGGMVQDPGIEIDDIVIIG